MSVIRLKLLINDLVNSKTLFLGEVVIITRLIFNSDKQTNKQTRFKKRVSIACFCFVFIVFHIEKANARNPGIAISILACEF